MNLDDYKISDRDYCVAITYLPDGETVIWETSSACKRASDLREGSLVAVAQGRGLTPRHYGLPGKKPLQPWEALTLAGRIFRRAARIDADACMFLGPDLIELTRPVGNDGAEALPNVRIAE